MLVRDREVTSIGRTKMSFVTEWIAGVVGALTTAVGLWMYYGPSDGVLRLFGWEWNVADLAQGWPFSVIIAGTVILAAVFARLSTRLSMDGPTTGSYVATGAAVVSLLAAITYALIWIF